MDSKSPQPILSPSHRMFLSAVLIAAACIRIGLLGAYPLTDNTEARYAEVAREMVATGEWITPQLHGVQFWSKPPLSIWIAAFAMKLFGINEFAARISALIPSLLSVWLVYWMAACRNGRDFALISILVLVSSIIFFVSSGAVMTDPALALGTTLSMVAFWQAVGREGIRHQAWGYLFFVGLAIGLLAKGPVGIVLTFLPVGLWVLWKRRWKDVWIRIPWIGGLLLTTALALPWYLAAEARTVGFLDYFIIGEHWRRFTQPGWAGDLYGTAHSQPRGLIWLLWLIAAFPWSFYVIASWVTTPSKFRGIFSKIREADEWTAYLVLWAISPMLFFSTAGNILWTYVLPGLPAFALLVSQGWLRTTISSAGEGNTAAGRKTRRILALGLATPLVFGLLIALWSFVPIKGSQKRLVGSYCKLRPGANSHLIYLRNRPYSAEFYSSGEALKVSSISECQPFLENGVQDFFAINKQQFPKLPADFRQRLTPVGEYDKFLLLTENNDSPSEE